MQKSSLTLSVVLLYIIDPWAQTSSANNMKYIYYLHLNTHKKTQPVNFLFHTIPIYPRFFGVGGGGRN